MKRSKVFSRVGGLNPGRSVFDLSYEKKLTCDMGQLIPIMCDEVVPGDKWKIGNQIVIRFQPLVAPVLHEINVYVHYFFVPNRLLWDDWEDFITGGVDGDLTPALPLWTPVSTALGGLWDFLGFPTGLTPTGALPVDFPKRAYNLVYNEYYRDETLVDEINIETNETIMVRAWEKDYFTSALPWQQRGTGPAIPISGSSSADWTYAAGTGATTMQYYSSNNSPASTGIRDALNNNIVDLSSATPFDIADFRIAFQIQKWMERNARCGARYTEFLKAHFGVSPRDDRLQRPEYIGGSKSPVIISEVLQTSQTGTTPQGNLAGHGISVSDQYAGEYHAEEFGIIIGIMSVMPRTAYSQGVDRQWLKTTKYDYYFPEFANLSEQAVINAEICARNADATHNQGIFGYQGRYDELRVKKSLIVNEMRSTYDYWHLARQFDPASPPVLNETFINCVPRKDIFAAPSVPGLIVQVGNIIKAVRPLPIMAEPGLIDHH